MHIVSGRMPVLTMFGENASRRLSSLGDMLPEFQSEELVDSFASENYRNQRMVCAHSGIRFHSPR